MAIIDYLAQFSAQLRGLPGSQGAGIVRQGMQLARQRLQRRSDRGLLYG
jgi:hypothetical protein